MESPKTMVTRTKKIFVGGLAAASTVEDLKNYFGKYGKVDEAILMFDKTTQRHRGFGFVTFENEDVVDEVCNIHYHQINGKMAECKRAQPKEVMLSATTLATRGRGIARGAYVTEDGEFIMDVPADMLLPELCQSPLLPGFFPAGFPAYTAAAAYGRGFPAQSYGPAYYYPAAAVLNNYPHGFAQATSPVTRFPNANSPGPLDIYGASQESLAGYVQTTSPQPGGFASLAGHMIATSFQNGYH